MIVIQFYYLRHRKRLRSRRCLFIYVCLCVFMHNNWKSYGWKWM